MPVPIGFLSEFGGGPHCVSLDLHRSGALESYFPLLDEMEARGEDPIFTPERPWTTAKHFQMASTTMKKPDDEEQQHPKCKFELSGAAIVRNSLAADVERILSSEVPSEPFAIFDHREFRGLVKAWQRLLPRVEPVYAVKANSHPRLLRSLAAQAG